MIRRVLFGNFALKVSSVVLAVVLWIFVVSKGQTEMSLNVPIEYSNIPQGLEIAKREAKTANVVIRTHESLAKNVRQETVRVFVDVSKAKKGEGTFPVRKDDVKLPYGASIVSIEPSGVKIAFEETVSKPVTISPDISGSPENGYYVKSIEVKPKEVIIEGAKSEVRKVAFVKTEPIDITGLTEDLDQEAGLKFPNGGVRAKVDKVSVHISIKRRVR
ncbi:MAG TPA: CdaR family protein [Thermodesulfovibrionales bacterium]|nr:CdaR family protein [Thermodesulfovibrionales bacterium]